MNHTDLNHRFSGGSQHCIITAMPSIVQQPCERPLDVNWLRVLQLSLTFCSIRSNSLLQVTSPFLVWLKYCVASSHLPMIIAEQPSEALPPHHSPCLTTNLGFQEQWALNLRQAPNDYLSMGYHDTKRHLSSCVLTV
jgi:hypothetical protein